MNTKKKNHENNNYELNVDFVDRLTLLAWSMASIKLQTLCAKNYYCVIKCEKCHDYRV